MKSIKEQIKEKSISGAYLLYGEEDFLKDYYCERMIDICTMDGIKEFNYMKINSDKIDNNIVTDFIVSLPMMSDKKVLLLKNTGIFSKANDATKKFWTEVFDDLPEYMVLIFLESTVDKRSSLYKAISKRHTAEEFPLSNENELISWFARYIAKDNKTMTKEDIAFVIESVGKNMYLLKNEADKLISYTSGSEGLISHDDVENCICKSLEGKVFALIDNIVSKDKSKAISRIGDLKTLKEQPVMIIALIFRQFSIMRKIKILEGKPISEIAQKTKQRDFVVKKSLSQLKGFSLSDLNRAISMCLKADEDIKSGASEPWLTVEKLTVLLMSIGRD